MTTETDLYRLEEKFWSEGAEFYRRNVDADCLLAFTQMAGVHGNDEIAKTAKAGRWRDVKITRKGLVEPTGDVAVLSYEARATKEDGAAYAALVSTGYVRRGDAWKMMFHQQTPLEAAAKTA